MISGKGMDTKPSMMSSADANSQSDMKEVIKVFLIKVANKTTSRYGVTLFLFCSSMWLLTQAFLALHNGCWISNPQILTKIKEKTSADCRMSPNSAGILKAEADGVEQDRERIPDALNHLLSHQKGDGAGERAVFNVIVERGVAAAPAESPVNIIEKDAKTEQHKEILNVPEIEREKRSDDKPVGDQNDVEPRNEKKEIPPVHPPFEKDMHGSIVKVDDKVDDKIDEKVDKAVGLQKEVVSNNASNTQAIERSDEAVSRQLDRQPTLKPFIPLPPGLGKPALDPVPYTIPTNISKDVVKITKDSWETMGCINRVTILTPGTNSLPNDTKWQQLYQSFRKYRMGYYLLKCPDNVCDIILRTGTSAKTIAGGSAVLVGPGTKKMGKKTRAIMDEVKRLTPDNLLKVYLFSLDNSPMINYYDPSMANFEYHYSMTYHSQSDVPIPYGRYRAGVGVESARNWAYGKKGLVAWVEDNCDKTFWPRIEYVRELNKHIAVDMYGTCGNRTCASTHCKEELKGYKFYLAFEEAACDEFITLHFWQRALSSGAVPVVYGGKKFAYTKVAPPDSFIHIADFDTPEALATYLHKLSGSDVEYNKFHHWRTLGSVQVSGPGFSLDSLCGMVPQLIHLSPPKRRVMSRGKFYRSCRKGIYVNGFAGSGDLSNWTPWR